MPPPEIDLIEILYGRGELSLPMAILQVGFDAAWRVIPALVRSQVAELWITEDGNVRPLAEWEVARLVRSRVDGSFESAPPDDALILRAGKRIVEAYERDFGDWYDATFGEQGDGLP